MRSFSRDWPDLLMFLAPKKIEEQIRFRISKISVLHWLHQNKFRILNFVGLQATGHSSFHALHRALNLDFEFGALQLGLIGSFLGKKSNRSSRQLQVFFSNRFTTKHQIGEHISVISSLSLTYTFLQFSNFYGRKYKNFAIRRIGFDISHSS